MRIPGRVQGSVGRYRNGTFPKSPTQYLEVMANWVMYFQGSICQVMLLADWFGRAQHHGLI